MIKRTFTWFLLLVALWLTCCGLFSSIEPDTNGYLNFGLPFTVYTDFNGLGNGIQGALHVPNLLMSLAGIATLAVIIAYATVQPLSAKR